MNYTIYSLINGQILRTVVCSPNVINNQYNNATESYVEGNFLDTLFYIENGLPVMIPPSPGEFYIFDYTTKQYVPNIAFAEQSVNSERVQLLYATDWTQLPNSPLTSEQQQQYAVYRQQLRDIPNQSGYPLNVIWPTKPI